MRLRLPRPSFVLMLIAAVVMLVLAHTALADEPKIPVNPGDSWRVYDATGKEVSRLTLERADDKTGMLIYTVTDPATGTKGSPMVALPWEVRDVIKTEIAKGDHAVRGYYLDRAEMNFAAAQTIKAADLAPAAPAIGGPGAAPGQPAPGAGAKADEEDAEEAAEKGAGPTPGAKAPAAPGAKAEREEADEGAQKDGDDDKDASPPAGPKAATTPGPGAGPARPKGPAVPTPAATEEEPPAGLPILPIAGGGAVVLAVVLYLLLGRKKKT